MKNIYVNHQNCWLESFSSISIWYLAISLRYYQDHNTQVSVSKKWQAWVVRLYEKYGLNFSDQYKPLNMIEKLFSSSSDKESNRWKVYVVKTKITEITSKSHHINLIGIMLYDFYRQYEKCIIAV